MIDRCSDPHTAESQSKVQWHIIVVETFQDDHGAELLPAQVQILTLFLANSPTDERFLRIVVLAGHIVKDLALWNRLVVGVHLKDSEFCGS